MIWATVNSWSCFCWLCRAFPSLAAKSIINLISLLTIWWCTYVECSLVLLEEGVCYDQCVLLAKLFCPASFCTPRPNLPVIPGVSWLPTFAFQSPYSNLLLYVSQTHWESRRQETPVVAGCTDQQLRTEHHRGWRMILEGQKENIQQRRKIFLFFYLVLVWNINLFECVCP